MKYAQDKLLNYLTSHKPTQYNNVYNIRRLLVLKHRALSNLYF